MNELQDFAQKKLTEFAPFAYRRPSLLALCAICSGIILGQFDFLSHWIWLTTSILAVLVAGVLLSGKEPIGPKFKAGVGLTLLGLLCLLAFRVVAARTGAARNHILSSVADGSSYRIYGYITDWPDIREHSTRLTVRVDSTARLVGRERYEKVTRRSGTVLVHVNTQSTDFQYADRVVFNGKFSSAPEKKNPGGFDYARYLRWKDIFGLVYLPHHFGIVRNPETRFSISGGTRLVRDYILSVFRKNLQEQPAALASGFLIGETAGIDDDIYQRFRRSGTLHLLAVSGSNVAVALLVLRLFLWPFPLGRRTRYFILILGAIFFAFLSHNDPSVVRASVMVTLFLIGRIFERRIDYHNLIASAGVIILFWAPNQLFDVGFQLSFAVAWALILFVGALNRFINRRNISKAYKFLLFPIAFAFVAQLSSTPIALYYFGVTPLNATISNLIIGPAVGIAVGLSLVLLGAASILPLLGSFVGSVLNVWLSGILYLLEYFGGAGSWQLQVGDFSMLSMMTSLAIITLLGMSLTSRRSRRVAVFALIIAPVVLLAPGIFGESAGNSKTIILASRGGICAIIGGVTPTVILSDIVSRPEQQFQYVLGPALRLAGARIGADGKINLAQLSADHTTLVNSLTICDSFPQTTLTLTKQADRMWQDHLELYGIDDGRYQPRFSSQIDSTSLLTALQRRPSEKTSVDLLVGSSLALQVSGSLRVLYLSSATDDDELNYVLAQLRSFPAIAELSQSELSQSEAPLIVVVGRLETAMISKLEKLSRLMRIEIVSGRKNHKLQVPVEVVPLITYVSEVGAVKIVSQ